VNKLKIIAFTHKTTDINDIGRLHLDDNVAETRLIAMKEKLGLEELFYLSTCNRVEFMIASDAEADPAFRLKFLDAFEGKWSKEDFRWAMDNMQVFEGEDALRHLFNVASSIDSMVVGEREIITQVRNAYEKCNLYGITGDMIRLVIKKTIEVAKEIYTETNIARNPVSVVSLAYRKLLDLEPKPDARFLIIGAGVTNTTMAQYLRKHKFSQFVVFNRSLANAEILAAELNGSAFELSELTNHKNGFDVILTCTGASDYIITPEIYRALLGEDKSKKIVIDLAIPNDLDPAVLATHDVKLISVNNLQEIAKENLKAREEELDTCKVIIEANIYEFRNVLKTRKVELAMSEVPKKVKEIREAANEVFAKEIGGLDAGSKEVLDKVIAYIEKKYISVPMKMAKEILTNQKG
jgi:glutamyl-tRNA reductase